MGKFVLVVATVTLFVYALFDLIATPADRARTLPKPLWFLVLLVPIIGGLLWLTVGKIRPADGGLTRPRPQRPQGPRGPDDDPDYLRGL